MQHPTDTPIRLLLIGDSIADCGRARPVGEGFPDALGGGYPKLLDAMTKVEHPAWRLNLINMATSGDRSRDLVARWQIDCLAQEPDLVLVMIGINDVWRHFDSPLQPQTWVSLTEYEENLRRMAADTRAVGAKILFASPYYLESNAADPMRAMTDAYRARMVAVAQELDIPYVDTQRPFDALLDVYSTYCFSGDRVHPNSVAQYVTARELLRMLETLFQA